MNAPSLDSRAVFPALLRALEPYANDIVLIGGWVHAIYLADASHGETSAGGPPIKTTDIDFTVPARLSAGDRPTLIDLAVSAGFITDESTDFSGNDSSPSIYFQASDGLVDLDFLTTASRPDASIAIRGQPGLVAHGYPDLHILLDNAEWRTLGAAVHRSVDPAIRVRVPIPAAYVLQKGLASARRPSGSEKQAKDLVYLYEVIRNPVLREQVGRVLPTLARQYSEEFARWANYLRDIRQTSPLVIHAVRQLMEANRAQGGQEQVAARMAGQVRRLVGEMEEALA